MIQRKAEKWGVNDDSPIDKTAEESEANAQLIAAAPDLLKALLSLMDGIANLPPLVAIDGVLKTEWEQGLKAINKALGKGKQQKKKTL